MSLSSGNANSAGDIAVDVSNVADQVRNADDDQVLVGLNIRIEFTKRETYFNPRDTIPIVTMLGGQLGLVFSNLDDVAEFSEIFSDSLTFLESQLIMVCPDFIWCSDKTEDREPLGFPKV